MVHIRYRFAPQKARAALHWMVRQWPGVDLHTALKTCYFADKAHLNKHNRPIFGTRYRAMKFGPVPVEIYEMAKGEPIWLAELGTDRYPWHLQGYKLCLSDNSDPDLSMLSDSDVAELEEAFKLSSSLDFNSRTALTHGRDWQAAEMGVMHYEDMLDETPDKSERVAYLREAARHFRL